MISVFPDEEIIKFSSVILKLRTNERKDYLEQLGLLALKSSHILELFNTDEEFIKSGIIFAAGYMKSAEINSWLVQRLYDSNIELASEALFSLAAHGTSGFTLIAKNLAAMPDRLVLSSINILTFNKVYDAFNYFPPLLTNRSTIIGEKVISSYSTLGEKAYKYINASLKIAKNSYLMQLLKLLEKMNNTEFIAENLFLLNNYDLQDYLIDIIFKSGQYLVLQEILTNKNYNATDKVFTYGIEFNSKYLFHNRILTNISLNYFLDNFSNEIVENYFKEIGFDLNYYEDYLHLVEIYTDIKKVKKLDEFNGKIDYVTRYFQLISEVAITEKNRADFFNGMENYLENNEASLSSIKSIKDIDNKKDQSATEEIEQFYKSLTNEELSSITEYNLAKNRIKRNYRALTFRFRNYGIKLLMDYGYFYLLNE